MRGKFPLVSGSTHSNSPNRSYELAMPFRRDTAAPHVHLLRKTIVCATALVLLAICAMVMLGTLALAGCGDVQKGGVAASKAEDIAGIWMQKYMEFQYYYTQFNEDGTFYTAKSVDKLESSPLESGTFWFEGTVFNIQGTAKPGLGRYEIRVRKERGESLELFFNVVDDVWTLRAKDFTAEGWPKVEP